MTSVTEPGRQRETLNICIPPEEKWLIDRAAQARGQNSADFVLDAVRQLAEEAILNRTLTVDQEAYEQWLERLNAPPQPSETLRRALQTPAPWE